MVSINALLFAAWLMQCRCPVLLNKTPRLPSPL